MTIAAAIRAAAERLAATSDTARLDAELLMAHALGMSRSDVLLRAMDRPAPSRFARLVDRRAAHEPIAYITGVQEFYGREFAVEPGVLIPRADSETLIEAAKECAPGAERVIDLGTGSGALLVTALLELERAIGIGIDASAEVVRIADANAQALGLIGAATRFLQRDWHTPGWAADLGRFDLVLCNPPYVEQDAALDRDVRDFEPAAALFAGPDGLDEYRALMPQIAALMRPQAAAIVEIGATQCGPVSELAAASGFTVEVRNDLANRPRALVLRT